MILFVPFSFHNVLSCFVGLSTSCRRPQQKLWVAPLLFFAKFKYAVLFVCYCSHMDGDITESQSVKQRVWCEPWKQEFAVEVLSVSHYHRNFPVRWCFIWKTAWGTGHALAQPKFENSQLWAKGGTLTLDSALKLRKFLGNLICCIYSRCIENQMQHKMFKFDEIILCVKLKSKPHITWK